jgi:hypothetical protein
MIYLNSILVQSSLILLCIGSIVAAFVGAGMLFAPERTVELNVYMSRWIDTRWAAVELDRPRWTERFFYRGHRVAGALLSVGASYVLYTFLLTPTPTRISKLFKDDIMGLWPAFSAFLVIGNVLAVFIGVMVFARPSLIRDIEKAANRWISTEFLDNFFGAMRMPIDEFVLRNKKTAGGFLLVGGVYTAAKMMALLLTGDWKVVL